MPRLPRQSSFFPNGGFILVSDPPAGPQIPRVGGINMRKMPENASAAPAKRPRSAKQQENDARNRERFKEFWSMRKSANKSVETDTSSVPTAIPARKTVRTGSNSASKGLKDHSETSREGLETHSNSTRDHSEPASKPKNKGLLGLGFWGL